MSTTANGEIGRGDLSDLLIFELRAVRGFVAAEQIADLERGTGAHELEHARRGNTDRIGVAAARALHRHAEELVVEQLLVGGLSRLIGLGRGGLGVIGIEIDQVADLDHRRGIDRNQHRVGLAIAPSHRVCHRKYLLNMKK